MYLFRLNELCICLFKLNNHLVQLLMVFLRARCLNRSLKNILLNIKKAKGDNKR